MSTTDYRKAIVYSPRADGEDFAIEVMLNRDEGGAQATRQVRCKEHRSDTCRAINDTLLGARLLEPATADRWIASVRVTPEPDAKEKGWQLALVVADRLARGVAGPFASGAQGRLYAYGHARDWESGRLDAPAAGPLSLALVRLRERLAEGDRLLLGDGELGHATSVDHAAGAMAQEYVDQVQRIDHLGALLDAPDAADVVRSYRVWFPLVGGHESLAWVQVTARPRSLAERAAVASGKAHTETTVLGTAGSFDLKVHKVLESSRAWDGGVAHHWHTSVRFSQFNIHDNSWQLALVLADRIARRREVAPRGRLIATGKAGNGETDWSDGRIGAVDKVSDKLGLILRVLEQDPQEGGHRVLLPRAAMNNAEEPDGVNPLRRRGVSVAWVERLRVAR